MGKIIYLFIFLAISLSSTAQIQAVSTGRITKNVILDGTRGLSERNYTAQDSMIVDSLRRGLIGVSQISENRFSTSSFSGSYLDLTDKPIIPTAVSSFTNDVGYQTNEQVIRIIGTVSAPIASSINTNTSAINSVSSIASAAMASYVVESIDGMIYARSRSANLTSYSGVDAYTVIQAAITALTNSGMQGSSGGCIHINSGSYRLSNELTITGWEAGNPPFSQIQIIGDGYSTRIIQNTAQKNAFVVKNRASVVISNMFISVGNGALSGILFNDNGNTNEISVWNGIVDNIKIVSSGSAPGFYAKNFFNLQIPHLDVECTNHHGTLLQNTTRNNTNYGNSNVGLLTTRGSSTYPYAGLALISDIPVHPINLINFNSLFVGAGFYGLYCRGAAYNTFTFADIEYVSNNIYFEGGISGVETSGNSILSGYLYTKIGGKSIFCADKTSGNSFKTQIESDDNSLVVIDDDQIFRASNSYELILGPSIDKPKIQIETLSQTPVSYKKIKDGVTTMMGPYIVPDLTKIAQNISPEATNIRTLGNASNYWSNIYTQTTKTENVVGRNGKIAISSATKEAEIGFYLNNAGIKVGQFAPNTGNLMLQNSGNFSDNGTKLQTTSFSTSITSKTSSYTATITDYTILANSSASMFSITLPSAKGATGRIYLIKKIDSSNNIVKIITTDGQTIDGANSYTLDTRYKYVTLQSDGMNWFIGGNN